MIVVDRQEVPSVEVCHPERLSYEAGNHLASVGIPHGRPPTLLVSHHTLSRFYSRATRTHTLHSRRPCGSLWGDCNVTTDEILRRINSQKTIQPIGTLACGATQTSFNSFGLTTCRIVPKTPGHRTAILGSPCLAVSLRSLLAKALNRTSRRTFSDR